MQHEGPRIRQALLSIGVRARSKGHDRKRNQRAGCSEGHMLVTCWSHVGHIGAGDAQFALARDGTEMPEIAYGMGAVKTRADCL